MRRTAFFSCWLVGCLTCGCSTMRAGGSQHPGITEVTPNAVTRTFPASATMVAQTMADVMAQDSILENISMVPDTSSKEFRNFSKADRQALKISLLTPANDVNFNIKAKCKDGQPIAVAVRLKGESSAEVSVLYGFGGEADLSRDLLDKAEAVLAASSKDASVTKTGGSKVASRSSNPR